MACTPEPWDITIHLLQKYSNILLVWALLQWQIQNHREHSDPGLTATNSPPVAEKYDTFFLVKMLRHLEVPMNDGCLAMVQPGNSLTSITEYWYHLNKTEHVPISTRPITRHKTYHVSNIQNWTSSSVKPVDSRSFMSWSTCTFQENIRYFFWQRSVQREHRCSTTNNVAPYGRASVGALHALLPLFGWSGCIKGMIWIIKMYNIYSSVLDTCPHNKWGFCAPSGLK